MAPRTVLNGTDAKGAEDDGTEEPSERYRPLPTGSHGLDPETVKSDQRERLRHAIVELIAEKGYQAVRIVDLARLARVSQPTFYALFRDKEDLLVSAYDEIAQRTGSAALEAYAREGSHRDRLAAGVRAFAELATAEPHAVSFLVLGAFGAGAKALEHRSSSIASLERAILAGRARNRPAPEPQSDLTIKFLLGGIREVTAIRLCQGREAELPALVEQLTDWATSYPSTLPAGLALPPTPASVQKAAETPVSARARAAEGRLPSGRSDLPRPAIERSQRERIVDATAQIVAEKGLGALTIPEIARRANVSHQTFYDIYPSKLDAFLGAQKVGLHQAFTVAVSAWEAEMPDWPRAIAKGLRALIDYLVSEPDHAHLSIVDTFGSSPETIEARDEVLSGFATYFHSHHFVAPAGISTPEIAPEVAVGGAWQVLHHYVESDRIGELPDAAPQLTFMLLCPFLGPAAAASAALAHAHGREVSA